MATVNPLAFVDAGVVLGLTALRNRPYRAIGPIKAEVTIEEDGHDELTITEHPVEQGAAVTDHAYKRPAEVTLHVGWSNSRSFLNINPNYAREIYDKLLQLQVSRELFTLFTGQRTYPNMLISTISKRTDRRTENALFITLRCRQVIITATQLIPLAANADNQKQPTNTQAVTNTGAKNLLPGTNYNAGAAPP